MDDEKRFEGLYRAHADGVHAYAQRRSDAITADEVVAEVFLVVWRRIDRVPAEAFPWLLGVARRVLANHRRSTRRALALRDRLGERLPEADLMTGDSSVLSALARLGNRDREVLLLIAWEGLSHAEVAEVLAIGRPAVATRLHRARQRFAEALAEADSSDVNGMEVRS